MRAAQTDLFKKMYPAGFIYRDDVIEPGDESRFMQYFADLPLKPFEFHGFLGNRRTASFGSRYDYAARGLQEAEPIPGFLTPLKLFAAQVATVPETDIRHALVTEYKSGAGIGWHRDKALFGKVIAFSFGAPAVLRFRRKSETTWERLSLMVKPRSIYVLSGAARHEWQHSIPQQDGLRYSVTFRTIPTEGSY